MAKCSVCGKPVRPWQVADGVAVGVRRDDHDKIVSRAFHHECVERQEEQADVDALYEQEQRDNDALFGEAERARVRGEV